MSELSTKSEKKDMPMWKRKGFSSEIEYAQDKAKQVDRIGKKLMSHQNNKSFIYEGMISVGSANERKLGFYLKRVPSSRRHDATLHIRVPDAGTDYHGVVNGYSVKKKSTKGTVTVFTKLSDRGIGGKVLLNQEQLKFEENRKNELDTDQSVRAAANILGSMRSTVSKDRAEKKAQLEQERKDAAKKADKLIDL